VKNIFFKPEKQPSDKLGAPCFLYPLRNKIVKNETEIGKILNTRGKGNAWMISATSLG